jgi:hypothetical protein
VQSELKIGARSVNATAVAVGVVGVAVVGVVAVGVVVVGVVGVVAGPAAAARVAASDGPSGTPFEHPASAEISAAAAASALERDDSIT